MLTQTELNIKKILLTIAQASENNSSQEYISATHIQKLTHLNSKEINDSVSLLKNMGLIEWIQGLGSHPYIFQSVKITPLGVNEAQRIIESRNDLIESKMIDRIYFFLAQYKPFVIIFILISLAAAIYTLAPLYDKISEVNNLNITHNSLHKIEIAHSDEKIIFKPEKTYSNNYETIFNSDLILWAENPSILNIYFENFSKSNNTVQKNYMATEFDNTNYKIYALNYMNTFEPTDPRNKTISLKIYLQDFWISGKYTSYSSYIPGSEKLNFYLGNLTLLINFKDLISGKETNITKIVPVYWINEESI